MCDAGRPLEVLDQILEQYQVIQHGVALYFGSTDRIDREQLKRLKTLVKRTKTPFLSDHLCWGSVDGTYTHDLLPMPYTFAAAKNTARRSPRGAGFPGSADHRGKRQQLCRVPRLGNDGMGIPHRGGRAGRLRNPAGREQHLRLQQEPRLRSLRLSEQHPAPPRGPDAHRRAQQIREVHSRHARSSGAGPGVEDVRPRDPQMRADLDAAGMGCAYPVVRGSASRSAQGEKIPERREGQEGRRRPGGGDRA